MTLGLKTAAPRGRNLGFISPVGAGLVAWLDLGDADLKERYLNRANRPVAPTPIGDPVEHTGYTTFSDSVNYLQTDLFDTASMTIIVVGRVPGTPNRAHFISNLRNVATPTIGGVSLHRSTTNLYLDMNGVTNTAASLILADANGSTHQMYAAVISSGVGRALYNLTAGTSITDAVTTARVLGVDKLRIGSRTTGTNYGDRDMNHVSWWNGALSKAEIDLAAAFIRERAAAKGIVV